MPIYEYICRGCGHEFDVFSRSMSAGNRPVCPGCRSEDAERRLSLFAARQGAAAPAASGTGCRRCGDPNGPCGSSS